MLIGALLLALSAVAARTASGQEAGELERVLGELREVETQIERQLIEETQRGGRRRAPAVAEEPTAPAAQAELARTAALRDELGLGVSDEIQTLARAKVEARMRLEEAETGMRLSAILLVDEVSSGRPDGADLLTLALIQGRHRAGANLAVEELLGLEQVRFARGTAMTPEADGARNAEPGLEPALMSSDESSLVPRAEPLPAEPGPMRTELGELRDRHRELSARLNELSVSAEQSRPSTMRFGEQRAQLNALMSRLARAGSAGAPGEVIVAPGVGTDSELVPALPTRPTVDEEKDGRRTFWRAKRARIHALTQGKVLFAGAFAGYRHLLILDHGDGWTTLYGNMTQCFVRQDDVMSAGSVLGEYQAEAIGNPEPFWLEVRQGAEPVAIESLPGIGQDWSTAIFGDEPQ